MVDIIEREFVFQASPADVFSAIAEPDGIVRWFPDGIDGSLAVGEQSIFDFGKDGRAAVLVVAKQPNEYFAYKWVSGTKWAPEGFVGDVLTEPHTLVEFFVSESANGTHLRVKERGFASLPSEDYEQAYADNTSGWDHELKELAALFA